MNNLHFHANFRLNEQSFKTHEEVLLYANTISSSAFSFLSDWFNKEDFITVQTSGSTGKPKLIQLKKEYMVNSAIATGTYFNLEEATTALLCLSTDYIAGKMMLVRALVLGWHIDVIEPSSYPLNGISKQYDFCAMVPLQLQNSLNDLSLVEKIIVGGGVVSKELQEKIANLKTEIFATYGMTETITHIAVKRLNHIVIMSKAKQSVNYKKQITSIENEPGNDDAYDILPNINISKDTRDCLVIYAPKVSDSQIVTNDIVEVISATKFKWLGRYDNVINSGGVKLVPEQIENKLSAVIDRRFFVAGITDAVFGEKLIIVIEAINSEIATTEQARFRNDVKNVTSSDSDENRDCIEKIRNLKSLSKYEIPKEIYFIEEFVETETKKIHRQATLAKLAL